jgi:DNA repair exonuclease SbcCD ATPase subunit
VISDFKDLQLRVKKARSRVDQDLGRARALRARGLAIEAELQSLRAQKESFEKAAAVLGSIGEQRQEQAQKKIESLVTKGLQTIFGEEYAFRIEQVTVANRPEVNFLVKSTTEDGKVIETDVLSSRGGGLASVVGFLLRVVIMLLSNKSQENIIFLDESFGMLSAEYEGRMAEFLKKISEETGITIVLVTHSDAYSDLADKRYRFDLNSKGMTTVKEI